MKKSVVSIQTSDSLDNDSSAKQQIIDALIAGMSNTEVKARQNVCSYLAKIYDENIEKYFNKIIEDEDKKIRLDAGFYLAAAKWLELTDWLKYAESNPNYINYISAYAVINQLEQQYNISKGEFPILTKQDFDKNNEIHEQYFNVIRNWLAWSEENNRASFTFFEEYREIWWENDPLRQD